MISVIIPVYNVKEYLNACIKSVLCQSLQELEIILVDDGSTDGSGSICDEYQKQDNRIRVIHKKNGGLSDARNAGLDIAHGEYIAFLDSDDIIHPEMYEYLLKLLWRHKADIAACGITRNASEIWANSELDKANVYEYTTQAAFEDIRYILISSCNKLYRKEIWNQLRFPVGKYHEDEFAFHDTIGQAEKIVATDAKLYYYVQREGSITYRLSEKRIEDAIEALMNRVKYVSKYQNERLTQLMQRNLLRYLVRTYKELVLEGNTINFALEKLRMIGREILIQTPGISVNFEERMFLWCDVSYRLLIIFSVIKENIYRFLRCCKHKLLG